jgi:hypothetical protein
MDAFETTLGKLTDEGSTLVDLALRGMGEGALHT